MDIAAAASVRRATASTPVNPVASSAWDADVQHFLAKKPLGDPRRP